VMNATLCCCLLRLVVRVNPVCGEKEVDDD